jgi:hypothetical protein
VEIEGEQYHIYVPLIDGSDKLIRGEAPFRHDEIAGSTQFGEQSTLSVGITETDCKAQ